MTADAVLTLFCATAVIALLSLVLQIYVSRQLRAEGHRVGLPIGKRSFITPFVLGWQNAKALDLTLVMVVWSVILAVSCICVFATAFAFAAYQP